MRKLFPFLLLVLCFAPAAFAWNDTGHMTIARVAYRQFDDATKQKVDAILRQHPHYQLFLTKFVPEGVTPAEWAFVKAATWPDFVRPSRPGTPDELFKGPEITRYHRGPWHYVDMPWVPPMDRTTIDPTTRPARHPAPASKPEGPEGALEAFDAHTKTLASSQASPQDRAVALAWIEHQVGDIHQPLHAVSMYSRDYPDGDQGGNRAAVNAGGTVLNLHSYWDGILGRADTYTALSFFADEILNDPQLAPAKLPELEKDRTFQSWANESREYAIALVYLNGKLRTTPYARVDAKEVRESDVAPLPPGYDGNARALSKRRMAAAGYRLAEQVRAALAQ
jgi:hypothetical protein